MMTQFKSSGYELIRGALLPFAVVLACAMLFWIADAYLVQMFYFRSSHASPAAVSLYLLLRVPVAAVSAFPLAVLIAISFSTRSFRFGKNAKPHYRSNPFSVMILAAVLGVVAGGLYWVASEYSVPRSATYATRLFFQMLLRTSTPPPVPRNITRLAGDESYVYIGSLDAKASEYKNVAIFRPGFGVQHELVAIAKRAVYQRNNLVLADAIVREYDAHSGALIKSTSIKRVFWQLPADVNAQSLAIPTEAIKWWQSSAVQKSTLQELGSAIPRDVRRGLEASALMNVTLAGACPIAALIGVGIGFTFGRTAFSTFVACIIFALIDFALIVVANRGAYFGDAPVHLIVWAPNSIMLLAAALGMAGVGLSKDLPPVGDALE